jgi:hypothetical protein
MIRRPCLAAAIMLAACLAVGRAAAADAHFDAAGFADRVVPLVKGHCLECHNAATNEGGLDLERFATVDDLWRDRDTWNKVLKQLRARAMPPDGNEPPAADVREAAVAWLEQAVTYIDPSQPADPGRVTARRLNSREYDLTIRDLLGVELGTADSFPDDDVGYGFDTIGDVLSVSPLRMELYLNSAETITGNLFYRPDAPPLDVEIPSMHFDNIPQSFNPTDRGRELGPGYLLQLPIEFPVPGTYEVVIQAWGVEKPRQLAGDELWLEQEGGTWDPDGPKVSAARVSVAGEEVGFFEVVEGNASLARTMRSTIRFDAAAGRQLLTIEHAFPRHFTPEEIAAHRKQVPQAPRTGVRAVAIRGPFGPGKAPLHPLHKRLLEARAEGLEPLLRDLLTRAYRRPAAAEEVAALKTFVEKKVEQGQAFDRAVELGVQAVLVSPQFLYRLEWLGSEAGDGLIVPLGDDALASRLSYFLWGSMPDDELIQLAARRELARPEVLRRQVARMLADPKSRAFVESFFDQWLELHKVLRARVDPELFKKFGSDHLVALREETLRFATAIVTENRPVLELITADYTFVNGLLAAHYGIPGVDRRAGFQRVSLAGLPRKGLLTQGSVLLLTSYPNRTSPTRRGNWILGQILGDEPPPAPPGVPTLEGNEKIPDDLSLRERLEMHRTNPTCVSCHETMDAIGFGFEHYDAIGRWRERDGDREIDSSGRLPSGETFDGGLPLVDIIAARQDAFVAHLTGRLMTFALGRGVEYFDRPAIEQVVRDTAADGHRFQDVVLGIVTSRPFLLESRPAAPAPQASESASTAERPSGAVSARR